MKRAVDFRGLGVRVRQHPETQPTGHISFTLGVEHDAAMFKECEGLNGKQVMLRMQPNPKVPTVHAFEAQLKSVGVKLVQRTEQNPGSTSIILGISGDYDAKLFAKLLPLVGQSVNCDLAVAQLSTDGE